MNRRKFLLKSAAIASLTAASSHLRLAAALLTPGRDITIVSDPADPVASAAPAQWAVGQLRDALAGRGLKVTLASRLADASAANLCVVAAGRSSPMARDIGNLPADAPEALSLTPGRIGAHTVLLAAGSDARGLAYALTGLADAVALASDSATAGASLQSIPALTERPANAIRSVMWVYTSDVEDKSWYYDRNYWRNYLTMLATQRFNRLNLAFGLGYDGPTELIDTDFYFTYPFLVSVPGYDVRVDKLPDAKRAQNLEMLRFISDEAAARGIQFYLGLWNHAYEWNKSPEANYSITGLTPETHATYSRDALALILKQCPAITGVTFRIHSESGVSKGDGSFWKTVFDGCVLSGRPVEFDLHAKGMNDDLLKDALATGNRVDISPKFSAEHQGLPYHQASIRLDEMVSPARELLLRYGYGDLIKEDRSYGLLHRIWPGTQRMLLWGDPTFAAAYSRAGGFCGSRGMEIFAHLAFKGRKGGGLPGGRDGYADLSLRAAGDDFEKFRYTYRLWGRMLYNPDTPADVWQRYLRAEHGAAAPAVESSLASASRILPLLTTAHIPSTANNNYWPEVPVNQSMVKEETAKPFLDTFKPRRFGNVSPLDPQLFYRSDDYVNDLLKKDVSGKYTPLEVAGWLDNLVDGTTRPIAALATVPRTGAFRRFHVDTTILASLGAFMSLKLRAGVLFGLYERTGSATALDAALGLYRQARSVWSGIDSTEPHAYVDDLTYGYVWFQRGGWHGRLQAIDDDIALMEQLKSGPAPAAAPSSLAPADLEKLIGAIAHPAHASAKPRPAAGVSHVSPASFHRGQPVPLALSVDAGVTPPQSVRLFYRHTNQAETWQSLPMSGGAGGFQAAIPADYADSSYPLSYYFEVVPGAGLTPTLYPGFSAALDNQPYFLVRTTV